MSFLTQIAAVTNKQQSSVSECTNSFELSRKPSQALIDMIIEPKTKWQKVLYELNYSHEKELTNYATMPVGFNLYKWLLEEQMLERVPLCITLPETLVKDENDVTYMLYTEKGRLIKKKVTVPEYDAYIQNAILSVQKEKNRPYLLKSQSSLDFRSNPSIPYLIERVPNIGKEHETLMDKEFITYRSTTEVKYKASRGKLLQRFIYSRNLKAMLLRLCYHTKSNESPSENYMHRAQNYSNLLRWNNRNQTYESNGRLAFVLIDKDCPDRFEFSTIRGKALKEY